MGKYFGTDGFRGEAGISLTAQADPDVQAKVQEVAEKLGDTGRILVRESGTEPVLRVMVEAPEQETCQQYVDEVVEVIRAKGHVAS